jgi:hypothetical protein
MTRKLATREAVFSAADSLKAQGLEVTVEKVTAQTGGSHSTVGPHLNAWFQDQKVHPTHPAPASIERLCNSLGNAVWAEAMRELQLQLAAAQERAAGELEHTKTALASSIVSNQSLEELNAELTVKLDNKHEKIAMLQLQIHQTRPHLEELHQVQCLADERLADNQQLREQIAKLEGARQAVDIQMQYLLALISPPRKPRRAATTVNAQAVPNLTALNSGPSAAAFQIGSVTVRCGIYFQRRRVHSEP